MEFSVLTLVLSEGLHHLSYVIYRVHVVDALQLSVCIGCDFLSSTQKENFQNRLVVELAVVAPEGI